MRRRIFLAVAATLAGFLFQGISCLNIGPDQVSALLG
jgi:hypothetical protein